MRNFEKKHVLRNRLDSLWSWSGGNDVFVLNTDLIYWKRSWEFQENEYDVSIRSKWKFSEIKIDDNWANTIIKKVPKGKEQEVLDYFYGRYNDSICSTDKYTYTPSMFKDMASKRVIWATRENLSAAEIQNRVLEIKSKAPKLYTKLVAAGILINDIENTEQLKKLEAYMDYLNFLYTVTRKSDLSAGEVSQEIASDQKSELVKRYLELESEKTDYIWNKEFLQFKFAEAIMSDIKRMWYFVVKDSNGAYKIKGIDSLIDYWNASKFWKIAIYSKLFETKNTNNSAIDTVILSNVIVHNPEMKKITSQKQFINRLLDKYNILPTKRKNIEDKTDYLILDNEDILKNIKDKLKNSKSAQEIKELSVLLDFVENKRWEQKTSYDRFNRANTYAKWFLVEKEFINAYRTGKLNHLKWRGSTMDKMTDFINNNRWGAVVMGIIAWLMGYKKTALWAIWFGLFGWAAMDLVKWWLEAAENTDEEIIKPIEKDQIWVLLKNDEYQDKFNLMVSKNSKLDNSKLEQTDKNSWVYIETEDTNLDPKKLNSMVSKISKDSINVDLTKIEDEVVTELHGKLWKDTYAKADVEKLVKLFANSDIKEEGDKTTLDYLSDGVDIDNRLYKNITPLIITEFNTELNYVLKKEYDNTKWNRKKRKNFNEIYEKIKWIFTWISNEDFKIWYILEFDSKVKDINTLIQEYSIEFPNLEANLKTIFDKFKNYKEIEDEVENFEWIFDENILKVQVELNTIFNATSLVDLHKKLTEEIKKLQKLKDDNDFTKDPFKKLWKDIDELISNLNKTKKDIIKKLREHWVDISISPIELNDFENNSEELRDNIKEYLSDIKAFNLDLATMSISDLSSKLSDIKDKYKWLNDWFKLLNPSSVTISTESSLKIVQEQIKNMLVEFSEIELQKNVEKPLKDFYTGNDTQLNKLDTIRVWTTPSSFIGDLAVLKQTKEHLNKNWVALENQIDRLEKSRIALLEAVKVAKQLAIADWSNISKVDLGIIDEAIMFFTKTIPDTATNISTYSWSKVDEVIKYVEETAAKVDWLNISDLTDAIKKLAWDVSKEAWELKNILSKKDIDKQAEKALKEGKKVFGDDEFLRWTPQKTLKNVLDKYNEKKEKVKTKAIARLSEIEWGISWLSNKRDFKEKYKEVKEIGKLFEIDITNVSNLIVWSLQMKLKISDSNNLLKIIIDYKKDKERTKTDWTKEKYFFIFIDNNDINLNLIGIDELITKLENSSDPDIRKIWTQIQNYIKKEFLQL